MCDHTNPPYFKQNGIVRDDDHRIIRLYPEVKALLRELHKKIILLGIASRTGAPEWADELMQLFDIKKYFTHFEIYPGCKVNHFRSLQEKTGMDYRHMIFFDDEYRNIDDVGRLGVDAVFVEDGMSRKIMHEIGIIK